MKIIKLPTKDYQNEEVEMLLDEPIDSKSKDSIIIKTLKIIGYFFLSYLLFFSIIFIAVGSGGKYNKFENTNFGLMLFGILLSIPFIIYLFIPNNLGKTIVTKNDINKGLVSMEVNNYIPLKVDLKNVKLIQNSFNYIDVLFIIPYPQNNAVIHFKHKFEMEYDNILLWFIQQKETVFYFDSKNMNNSYIDLRFMEN